MSLPIETYHLSFRHSADSIADLTAASDALAPVPSCPGWNVRDLVIHLGTIHRWAAHAARTGEKPPREVWLGTPTEATGSELADWYRDQARELISVLQACDPSVPTWHVFPAPMVNALWHRRQAHETMVHAWDLEAAVGTPAALDPEMASDGIDEYFEYMLPRRLQGDGAPAAPADHTLHVHCTDVDGEWFVWADDGAVRMTREHKKGDAALRGRAEDLLLTLWGRSPVQQPDLAGDQRAADAWLALGSV